MRLINNNCWIQRKSAHILLAAVIAFFTTNSYASGWSGFMNISELRSATSAVYVSFTTAADNPDSCGNSNWYILQFNHAGFDNVYALLLASSTSDKPIRFFVSGCNTYPIIITGSIDVQS